jgi:hypothetical protein
VRVRHEALDTRERAHVRHLAHVLGVVRAQSTKQLQEHEHFGLEVCALQQCASAREAQPPRDLLVLLVRQKRQQRGCTVVPELLPASAAARTQPCRKRRDELRKPLLERQRRRARAHGRPKRRKRGRRCRHRPQRTAQ